MKHYSTLTLTLFLVLATVSMLTLSSCSGKIDGQIFYDANNNGIFDEGEKAAGYVKVMVMRNDKLHAEGYSNQLGYFSAKSPGKGTYCVKVDTSNILGGEPDITPSAAFKLDTASVITDEDPYEDPYYEDPYYEDEEEVEEEATTYQVGWTTQGFCAETKRSLNVSIPIKIDYSEVLGSETVRLPISCYAGEICKIGVPYPKNCELKNPDFSDGITFLGFEEKNSNILDSSGKAMSVSVYQPIFGPKDKKVAEARLEISEDIELGTTSIGWTPVADCNGEEIPLQQIIINLKKEIDVTLYLTVVDDISGNSNRIHLTAELENIGRSPAKKGELKMFINGGGMFISIPSECYDHGTHITCPIGTLDSMYKKKFVTTVEFKQDLSTYRFSANFLSSDLGSTDVNSEAEFIPDNDNDDE